MNLTRSTACRCAGGLAGACTLALLTYPLWRPWCVHWGASRGEIAARLPGDDLLTDPDIVTTRVVSVDAPPSSIWPWLIQMGPGRGGAYTYDWIENLAGLDMHSADCIVPEFADLRVGDHWKLGARGAVLRVASLVPTTSLVLRSDDTNWVWAFVLLERGGSTRLLSRNRIRLAGMSAPARLAMRYLMEPGSLVMERKMLLGIKERVERPAPRPGPNLEPAPTQQEVAVVSRR